MKNSIILLLLVLLSSGCGAWWESFKENPINTVNGVVNTMRGIVDMSQVVFGQIKPLLPPAEQEKAQREFDDALVNANHFMTASDHALRAAAEAQEPNPDMEQMKDDNKKAAEQLQAVVKKWKSRQIPDKLGSNGKPSVVRGEAELDSMVINLNTF